LALLRKHCGDDILEHALILRHAPSQTIKVRALVHDIEHERSELSTMLPSFPEHFEGEVLACDNFRGLLECLDECSILRNARDGAGIELAIRIKLYKSRLARSVEPNWDEVRGMRIGPNFGMSIRSCCKAAHAALPNSALRAVIETIDGLHMEAVHALRTGPGGNDPQRVRGRDGARAWRRDVDWEYHLLHYWKLEDGTVEFASIGVHNDFAIPE
jgi:hypothetical protein